MLDPTVCRAMFGDVFARYDERPDARGRERFVMDGNAGAVGAESTKWARRALTTKAIAVWPANQMT